MASVAVSSVLPLEPTSQAPVVLIHGAANSARVWTFWQQELARQGWSSHAVDLCGHGHSEGVDLATTSMTDYATDVRTVVRQLARPPIVIGWSMGGLVAMMVAATENVAGCVGLAPSLPARQADDSVALRHGTFGAEEYGILGDDPNKQRVMPDLTREERQIALSSLGLESRLARDERKRGIVIKEIGCPLLIVTGSEDRQWPSEQYDALWLQADRLIANGASHWGLVLNQRALTSCLPSILDWMRMRTGGGRTA